MKTFPERIKFARISAGLKQEELAERVRKATQKSFTQQSLQYLETKAQKSGFTSAIATATGFNADWLASGFGKQKQEHDYNVNENTATYLPNNKFPVISFVQAGDWIEAIDEHYPGTADEWISIDGNFGPRTYALKVEGDSMTSPTTPSIPNGSTIIVDPDVQAEHGSLVIAKLINSNEVTFKRLSIDGNHRYLEPLNPRYQPIEINGNCIIVGVVKQAVMKF